jgi:predicted transcriptional regulator
MPENTQIKDEARQLVEELPENATWSDFVRLVIERQRIEEGIADLDAGITWTTEEIRDKLHLPK